PALSADIAGRSAPSAGKPAGATAPAAASSRAAGPMAAAEPQGPAGGSGSPGPGEAAGCASFEGSFEAIQKLVFEAHGCTAKACHGEAKVGDLDLRAESAWENLVDKPSANDARVRVQPGAPAESFLYLKLRAATEPGSVSVAGSPMPVGTAPLPPSALEAIQLWIRQGAPKTGSVSDPLKGTDVGSLLDACLPPPRPVQSKPLAIPARDVGAQIKLPEYVLKGGAETETCTPFAFDLTNDVPDQFKDVANNAVYVNGSQVRQDPQSHHLIVWDPKKDLSTVAADDPSWTCHGGPQNGQPCNAQRGSADCGAGEEGGVCAGPTNAGSLCGIETLAFGSGTPEDIIAGLLGQGSQQLSEEDLAALLDLLSNPSGMPGQIANAQTVQQRVAPIDGVFMKMPLRGIMWFNSHAFNLTDQDTTLHARVNWYYATKREREMVRSSNTAFNNIADGQAPFTRETHCGKHEVPQNHTLVTLTGHTHRRGEHFYVKDASGKTIYESFDYNDPAQTTLDPWMEFASPDAAARTLEFCATFNNGLKKDGSPDMELVTRASRMPERGSCTPIACVSGKLMAACETDADCDTSPGAADGSCDACAIKAGQTTENEMFVMTGWYILPTDGATNASP
ncbi:MAG: hypothetical protein ABW321_18555, partial [Polyangiales bacterium]